MLRAHIAVCGVCLEYRRQLRILRIVLLRRFHERSASTAPKLSDAARLRIREALR